MSHRTISLVLPTLLLLLTLSGCDETVDPFIDSERFFTIFGNLDMNADTQFVRVIPISPSLGINQQDPLDVEVRSQDLLTGETSRWTDSLFTFTQLGETTTGHVFFLPERVQPGHTYRFEVEQPDGNITWAETTLPSIPEVFIDPIGSRFGLPSQKIHWQGIDRTPFSVQVVYRFLESARAPFTDLMLDYSTDNDGEDASTWTVDVRLGADQSDLFELFGDFTTLAFMGMGMRITILDEAFMPPGGVFDPEVLVQPGTFSNVENGFGFLGSIGRFSVEWVLPDETVTGLGMLLPSELKEPEPPPPPPPPPPKTYAVLPTLNVP